MLDLPSPLTPLPQAGEGKCILTGVTINVLGEAKNVGESGMYR